MYISKIIPLAHLPFSSEQVFDYFSKENLARGSIVEIELAKKLKLGFVLESNPVEGLKAYIKRLTFTLKPIKKVVLRNPFFTEQQVQLAIFLSEYFAAPLSLSFKKFFLYPLNFYKNLEGDYLIKDLRFTNHESQVFFADDFDEKVLAKIKNTIRESKQVLVLAPSIFDSEIHTKKMQVLRPFTVGEKKNVEDLKKIRNGKVGVVIANKSGIFLPFADVDLIIVLEEDSEHYKFWGQKPYFHAKIAAEKLARLYRAQLILVSQTPSVETYFKIKQKQIARV